MRSPESARDVDARPTPGAGEHELKFTLPNSRASLARQWLECLCRRDPAFPAAVVWTIYYDTSGLVSLAEKINSDYLKRKIRVRWYSDLEGRPAGPSFVEAKFRIGNRRFKVRVRLPYPAADVSGWDLQDARLQTLPSLLQEHGIPTRDFWQPVVLIRYRRDRFIEPLSNSRVSLDADIAAAAVNPMLVSGADYTSLGTAVVEVKGTSDELPMALRPLLQIGVRKGSFSKFLAVYSHVTRRGF